MCIWLKSSQLSIGIGCFLMSDRLDVNSDNLQNNTLVRLDKWLVNQDYFWTLYSSDHYQLLSFLNICASDYRVISSISRNRLLFDHWNLLPRSLRLLFRWTSCWSSGQLWIFFYNHVLLAQVDQTWSYLIILEQIGSWS